MQTHLVSAPRLEFFRLEFGENLNVALEDHLKHSGFGSLWLYGLQAQVHSVTLGFWDTNKQAYDREKIQPLGHSRIEPGAISGNVTWVDGKPFAHIHGAFFSAEFSEQGKLLGGGHICELIAGRTLEGFIAVSDTHIERVLDKNPNCMVKTWRFPGESMM